MLRHARDHIPRIRDLRPSGPSHYHIWPCRAAVRSCGGFSRWERHVRHGARSGFLYGVGTRCPAGPSSLRLAPYSPPGCRFTRLFPPRPGRAGTQGVLRGCGLRPPGVWSQHAQYGVTRSGRVTWNGRTPGLWPQPSGGVVTTRAIRRGPLRHVTNPEEENHDSPRWARRQYDHRDSCRSPGSPGGDEATCATPQKGTPRACPHGAVAISADLRGATKLPVLRRNRGGTPSARTELWNSRRNGGPLPSSLRSREPLQRLKFTAQNHDSPGRTSRFATRGNSPIRKSKFLEIPQSPRGDEATCATPQEGTPDACLQGPVAISTDLRGATKQPVLRRQARARKYGIPE